MRIQSCGLDQGPFKLPRNVSGTDSEPAVRACTAYLDSRVSAMTHTQLQRQRHEEGCKLTGTVHAPETRTLFTCRTARGCEVMQLLQDTRDPEGG